MLINVIFNIKRKIYMEPNNLNIISSTECYTFTENRQCDNSSPEGSQISVVARLPSGEIYSRLFSSEEFNQIAIQFKGWNIKRTISSLAEELLLHIFSYVDFTTLIKLPLVCRRFEQLSNHPFLWKDLAKSICLPALSDNYNEYKLKVFSNLKFLKSQYKYESLEYKTFFEIRKIKIHLLKQGKFSDNKEIVLAAIMENGKNIKYAGKKLRNDHDIILAAVSRWGLALQYASDALKEKRDIVFAAVKQNGYALKYANEKFRDDKLLVIAALKSNGYALEFASKKLRDNKEVALEALQSPAGHNFHFVSNRLKADKDIAIAAAKQSGWNFPKINIDLRKDVDVALAALSAKLNRRNAVPVNGILKYMESDRCGTIWDTSLKPGNSQYLDDFAFILSAVQINGGVFQYASERLKGIRDIVLAAVQSDYYYCGKNALAAASKEFRDDKGVVLAAVRKRGLALQYASDSLKDDRDVVLAAVRKNGNAFQDASLRLRCKKEIVLAAMQARRIPIGRLLLYTNYILKNDKEVVLAAVRQSGCELKNASEKLKDNIDVVLAAVCNDGESLQYASDRLKNNSKIVLAAVRQNVWALQHASERLKGDKVIVMAALQTRCKIWETPFRFASAELRADRNVVLKAVQQSFHALEYANEILKNDKEIVLEAIRLSGPAFKNASDSLKDDRDFVLKVVRQSSAALEYVSPRLRKDKDIVLAAVTQKSFRSDSFGGIFIGGGLDLEFADPILRADKDVVLAAVRENGLALMFASDELKRDREVVLAAARQDSEALEYASSTLKNDPAILRQL